MRCDVPILTNRLRLVSLDETAATGPYLQWMQDPRVLRFLEARHATHDKAALAAFIRAANASVDSLLLGIFSRGSSAHLGNIKLGPIDVPNRRGELGFLIGSPEDWGKGYAREAIIAVAAYGFGQLRLHKLTAGYLAPNEGSGRALAAAGFRLEARLAEHFQFEGGWVDGLRVARFEDPAGQR